MDHSELDPITIAIMELSKVPVIGPYVAPTAVTVLAVMGVCSAVAAHMPPPKTPGGAYAMTYKIINILGHNYGYAANVVKPIEDARKKA